jgi:ABC-2 type transport system ATP-binding protein
MIEVSGLSKTYRVPVRAPGVMAAAASLIRRTYRTVDAVSDVSFRIGAGEIVGFLGPNGAGKTTTLKVLSGLLHPTTGVVSVLGHTPHRREIAFLRSIALVMGQKNQLAWDLPAADSFELHRVVYDLERVAYAATLQELDELLELGELLKKPVRQLSLGERMRCELALSLVHQPKVLFLDEPTIGLDVAVKASVRQFLKAYGARTGATILLTSHDMDDVAALCSRVVVIDHGKLSYDGTLTGLTTRIRPERHVILHFEGPVDDAELAKVGDVVSRSPLTATLRVEAGGVKAFVTLALASLPVRDIAIERPPLEDIMADLFRKTPKSAGRSGAS